jgi:hypothetical protein
MIPIDDCKDGWLYIIRARNSYLGVYKKDEEGFTIRRVKFTSVFLFIEYHWDTGEPYGTAKPLKELYQVPPEILNGPEEEILSYLEKKNEKYQEEIQETLKNETKIPDNLS